MARVAILRNEVPDAAMAGRFEREIADALAHASPSDTPFTCAILDEGLHAEIEIELPGWTERLLIPYPAAAGDVRRAVRRLLQDLGLDDEVETFHLLEGRAATDR
jgi:hypothetical protein